MLAETLARAGHEIEIAPTSRTHRFSTGTLDQNGVHYRMFPNLMTGGFRHGAAPWDTRICAAALEAALAMTAGEIARARGALLGRFNWAACAAGTMAVYHKALTARVAP